MNIYCGILWCMWYAISAAMLVCNIIFCISFSSCLMGAVSLVNFAVREYENLKLHFTFLSFFSNPKRVSQKVHYLLLQILFVCVFKRTTCYVKRPKFRFVTLILRTVELSFAVLIMYEAPSTPGLSPSENFSRIVVKSLWLENAVMDLQFQSNNFPFSLENEHFVIRLLLCSCLLWNMIIVIVYLFEISKDITRLAYIHNYWYSLYLIIKKI